MPSGGDLIDEARLLRETGRYGAAWHRLAEARGHDEANPAVDAECSALLACWGRYREAAALLNRSLRGGQLDRPSLLASAVVLANAGIAIEWPPSGPGDPPTPAARRLEAEVLRSNGRYPGAVARLESLARDDPENVSVRMSLADCLYRTGRDGDARAMYEQVVALDPTHALAWAHIAAIDVLRGRYDEAFRVYERGLELDPTIRGSVIANHAIARFHAGQSGLSRDMLLDLLPAAPDLHGHMQLGPSLLSVGRMEEGWKQYEFRWLNGHYQRERPGWTRPHWNGQDLDGKSILVVREQGIGDFFQFARYLPLLEARGARLLLSNFVGVRSIVRRFLRDAVFIEDGSEVPDHDYFAFMMSLPRVFATTLDTIPPPLHGLRPTEEHASAWRLSAGRTGKLRVGVVWAGRPEHLRDKQRSIPLEQLASVLAIEGMEFVALQKGTAVMQAEAVQDQSNFTSLGPALDTLEDAMAVLDQLDLLVTVDTAVAHIAATMGKPVWMLVAHPPDFRWLEDGDSTRWYPSMRLFRQRVSRDWSEPVARLAEALVKLRDCPAAENRTGTKDLRPVISKHWTRPLHLARALPMRHGFLQYDPDEPQVGASLECYGEWIEPALNSVLPRIPPGGTVIMSRPGVGAHALPLARHLGARGTLLLFEPRLPYFHMLANNLRAHGAPSATTLLRSVGGAREPRPPDLDTVDDLGLDRLDALLLYEGSDVEGAIEGAQETLWRCRPAVFASGATSETMRAASIRLQDMGYTTTARTLPLYDPENFNRAGDRTSGLACTWFAALPEDRLANASPAQG